MKYAEKTLIENEKIIYKANIDWFIFLPGLLLLVIGIYGLYMRPENLTPLRLEYVIPAIFLLPLVTKIPMARGGNIIDNMDGSDIDDAIEKTKLLMKYIVIPIVVISVLYMSYLGNYPVEMDQPIIGLMLYFIGEGIYRLIKKIFYKISTELVVTNKRIVYKTGFIKRKTVELSAKQIEGLSLKQSILGRVFNFGDISMYGTGGVVTPINDVDTPLVFRKKASELIDSV